MQIEVNDVKAHVAGTDHAHHRIEVRSIIITQTASFVNNLCDIQNIFIKDAHGVGVGEHQTGGVGSHCCPQGLHIHAAVRAGGDVDDLEAGHHRRGGVGAVGGVGDDDLVAAQLTTAAVVGLDEQQAGELTMGAGGRLEGHGVHASDLPKQLLRQGVGLQAALDSLLGLEGVDLSKAGQGGHILVDFGIILHGAGAQRVEPVVDAVDPLAQSGVVAGELGL